MEVQATISRTDLTKLQTLGSIILLSFFEYWACALRYLIRKKLVCIFVIFGRINIFSVFRSELERYSRFSNVLHLLRGRNHFFRSDFIFRLENPFKTPPVAIKRILWTCLVISWSQAPLSRSKAKSDGFTLYLSVSQIALSSCLRPFSSKVALTAFTFTDGK